MRSRVQSLGWSAAAIALFFVLLHAIVLPPEGFFCGDQGAKYLQARAFAEHGPLRPGIDVLSRDLDPEYRYQEPILRSRDGRLVAGFSWLLPLLSAPFLRLLGLNGLYVVPALSAIAIFLAAANLGRKLGVGNGLWSAWTVMIAAPVVFYGAELWEHAPAAAAVLIAAALFAPDGRRSGFRFVAAGACLAVGALFREEVFLALPAFVFARAVSLGDGGRTRDAVIGLALALLGAIAVFLAMVPMNIVVYGSVIPLHLTQEIDKMSSYWETRWIVSRQILLPDSYVPVFVVAVTAALGAAAAHAWHRRRTDVQAVFVGTLLRAITHACVVTLVMIAVAIPLWRQTVLGIGPYWAYRLDSVAQTWLFLIALAYWPLLGPADARRDVGRFLFVSSLVVVAGTLAIIPSPGGAQWSPRYLFAAAPLLAVLASVPAYRVSGLPGTSAARVLWGARAVLLCSVVAQVCGLLYLRDAKARNARITGRLELLAARGEVVMTNVFWIPEIAATLLPSRAVLLVPPAQVSGIASLVAQRGYPAMSIVTSEAETGYAAPYIVDASQSGCRFTRVQWIQLRERGLIFQRYDCIRP